MTAIAITITQIVLHTPVWVWFILLALVWRGLLATRPRDVGLGKLLLLPFALVTLSALGILGSGMSSAVLAGMAVGAMVGVAAGLTLERRHPATALDHGRVRLAGEWTPMVAILVVFLTHYVAAVASVIAPELAAGAPFRIAMSAISTFSSLMLVTRTVLRLKVLLPASAVAA